MASFGEKKLGKNLPQHKLMQDLLNSNPPRKIKIAKSTQTVTSEPCSCKKAQNGARKAQNGACKAQNGAGVKTQISFLEANLIASIQEKINMNQNEDFCSCSDSWSEGSGDGCTISFPRETRNAVAMLMSKKRPKSSLGVWPGVAERMNGEMMAKITSKLSKNKLEMN